MKTACFFRVDLKEYLFIWRNKIEKKNFTKKTTLNAATLNNVEYFEFVQAQFSWIWFKILNHEIGLYRIMEYHLKI